MRTATILVLTLLGTDPVAAAPRGPDLGQPAEPHEVARWDIDVAPDGRGLPPGAGTAAAGERLYVQHCQSCHGRGGLGDSGDQLAGARMRLTDEWPEKTIGTFWPYAPILFDFIRRSMPMEKPGTLSDDDVYALTAYLLYLNNLIDRETIIDADSLPRVSMPNRNGFVDWSGDR